MADVYNSAFTGAHNDEYNTRLTNLESLVTTHYNEINAIKLPKGLGECNMTGDLYMHSTNLSNTTPTANTWGRSAITFYGSNTSTEAWLGKIEAYSMTDSRKGVKLYGRNSISDAQCALLLLQYDDGTKSVSVSNKDAWCEKTCNFSGTTTISTVLDTTNSAFTIKSLSFYRWGKVANLAIDMTNNNALTVPAHGNIGDSLVGTLKVGYRPLWQTAGSSTGDGEGGPCFFRIRNDNGIIYYCWSNGQGSSRSIAAGGNFYLRASYIIP